MLLLGRSAAVEAQISVGIGLPSVSIGVNFGAFPNLVLIPGYPVYYDPQVDANYFFYGGDYWIFRNDNWYSSSWYNGPWQEVNPYGVPLYVLRVPVRYYGQPPPYFQGWVGDDAPRWGDHWGHDWEQRRAGWDRWNRGSVPAAAPLPVYQRRYAHDRYPATLAQQRTIQYQNHYRQPRPSMARPQAAVNRQHADGQRRAVQQQRYQNPQQRYAQQPHAAQQQHYARPPQEQQGPMRGGRPAPAMRSPRNGGQHQHPPNDRRDNGGHGPG